MSQGWFRGSVGWVGEVWGTARRYVTSRCHVYFAFYVHYAYYATYCSQHSHHSSVCSLCSPSHTRHPARVLTWLDLFLTSLVGFLLLRLASSLFIFFLSPSICCHLLFAVSLSCRDLWSATCHHHPLSCRRSTGIGHLHLSMEQAACLNAAENICLFTHTHTHRQKCFLIESWPCLELSAFQCC